LDYGFGWLRFVTVVDSTAHVYVTRLPVGYTHRLRLRCYGLRLRATHTHTRAVTHYGYLRLHTRSRTHVTVTVYTHTHCGWFTIWLVHTFLRSLLPVTAHYAHALLRGSDLFYVTGWLLVAFYRTTVTARCIRGHRLRFGCGCGYVRSFTPRTAFPSLPVGLPHALPFTAHRTRCYAFTPAAHTHVTHTPIPHYGLRYAPGYVGSLVARSRSCGSHTVTTTTLPRLRFTAPAPVYVLTHTQLRFTGCGSFAGWFGWLVPVLIFRGWLVLPRFPDSPFSPHTLCTTRLRLRLRLRLGYVLRYARLRYTFTVTFTLRLHRYVGWLRLPFCYVYVYTFTLRLPSPVPVYPFTFTHGWLRLLPVTHVPVPVYALHGWILRYDLLHVARGYGFTVTLPALHVALRLVAVTRLPHTGWFDYVYVPVHGCSVVAHTFTFVSFTRLLLRLVDYVALRLRLPLRFATFYVLHARLRLPVTPFTAAGLRLVTLRSGYGCGWLLIFTHTHVRGYTHTVTVGLPVYRLRLLRLRLIHVTFAVTFTLVTLRYVYVVGYHTFALVARTTLRYVCCLHFYTPRSAAVTVPTLRWFTTRLHVHVLPVVYGWLRLFVYTRLVTLPLGSRTLPTLPPVYTYTHHTRSTIYTHTAVWLRLRLGCTFCTHGYGFTHLPRHLRFTARLPRTRSHTCTRLILDSLYRYVPFVVTRFRFTVTCRSRTFCRFTFAYSTRICYRTHTHVVPVTRFVCTQLRYVLTVVTFWIHTLVDLVVRSGFLYRLIYVPTLPFY